MLQNKSLFNKVLIVAGRSGGHIFPGLAVGRVYHAQGSSVIYVAENRVLDKLLLQPHSWLTHCFFLRLHTVKPCLWMIPVYLLQFICAFFKSLYILIRWRVERVISMGGYCSIPICYAALCLRIPYVVYELNAEAGKAVKWLIQGSTEVKCCFESAALSISHPSVRLIPYPLFIDRSKLSRNEACASLSCDSSRFTFVVMGGSQGSRALNQVFMQWVRTLSLTQRAKLQIFHQTGSDQSQCIRTEYEHLGISAQVCEYTDEISLWYATAQYVVTRAGSGALHELHAAKIPALIIPLEAASTMHQVANAQEFVRLYPDLYCTIRQNEVIEIQRALNRIVAHADSEYTLQK